jgi:hypothetical protein
MGVCYFVVSKSLFVRLPQRTSIVVDLDQSAFSRFLVIGHKRSLIIYVALEGAARPNCDVRFTPESCRGYRW